MDVYLFIYLRQVNKGVVYTHVHTENTNLATAMGPQKLKAYQWRSTVT